jgi:hypothetical protein
MAAARVKAHTGETQNRRLTADNQKKVALALCVVQQQARAEQGLHHQWCLFERPGKRSERHTGVALG